MISSKIFQQRKKNTGRVAEIVLRRKGERGRERKNGEGMRQKIELRKILNADSKNYAIHG